VTLTPIEIALEFIEAISNREFDRIPDFYDAEARIEDPGGAVFHGAVALQSHIENIYKAFPDLRHIVTRIVAAEDAAVVQGRMKGTQTGPIILPDASLPASGREVDVRFAFAIHIRNGKILHDDLYFDTAEMFGSAEA